MAFTVAPDNKMGTPKSLTLLGGQGGLKGCFQKTIKLHILPVLFVQLKLSATILIMVKCPSSIIVELVDSGFGLLIGLHKTCEDVTLDTRKLQYALIEQYQKYSSVLRCTGCSEGAAFCIQ